MKTGGFTFIELLVTISIISFLSSIVMSNVNSARVKTRDNVRVQNVLMLHKVLEAYYADYGEYPSTMTPGGPGILQQCNGNFDNYIPGVVQLGYIEELPTDPSLNCEGVAHSWSYSSSGQDYKLVTHVEIGFPGSSFNDPAWDGGPSKCILDGEVQYHYGIWTPGAACWEI